VRGDEVNVGVRVFEEGEYVCVLGVYGRMKRGESAY
jgi:hypothetical protein